MASSRPAITLLQTVYAAENERLDIKGTTVSGQIVLGIKIELSKSEQLYWNGIWNPASAVLSECKKDIRKKRDYLEKELGSRDDWSRYVVCTNTDKITLLQNDEFKVDLIDGNTILKRYDACFVPTHLSPIYSYAPSAKSNSAVTSLPRLLEAGDVCFLLADGVHAMGCTSHLIFCADDISMVLWNMETKQMTRYPHTDLNLPKNVSMIHCFNLIGNRYLIWGGTIKKGGSFFQIFEIGVNEDYIENCVKETIAAATELPKDLVPIIAKYVNNDTYGGSRFFAKTCKNTTIERSFCPDEDVSVQRKSQPRAASEGCSIS